MNSDRLTSSSAYKMRGKNARTEMEEVAAELRQDDDQLRVRFRKNSKSEEPGEGDIVFENIIEEKNDTRARKEQPIEIKNENDNERNKVEKSGTCTKRIETFLVRYKRNSRKDS